MSTSKIIFSGRRSFFDRFAGSVTRIAGSPWAFAVALGCVILWAITGPAFNFGESWQMVINTGTTIVTFLMVFLIQRAQNKDALAIQLKLNELVAAMAGASNRLIDVRICPRRSSPACTASTGSSRRWPSATSI